MHERSPTARRTHDTIPSVTASTDQDTSTGDVTRDVRTGLAQDVTRTSSSDDNGEDVVMREDNAGENRAEHPYWSDSRKRITTKREPREVRDEQTSITEPHVPRRISGVNDPVRAHSCGYHTRGTGRIP